MNRTIVRREASEVPDNPVRSRGEQRATPKRRRGGTGRLLLTAAACVLLGAGVGGCGSPPSVLPAMRVVEATLRAEADRLEAGQAQRDGQYLQQARADLARGFGDDLRAAEALDVEWIDRATRVYVAAREALLRQELALARQREVRAENLRLAAAAQARAMAVLQQQDRLLQRTLGLDLWRIDFSSVEPEPSP